MSRFAACVLVSDQTKAGENMKSRYVPRQPEVVNKGDHEGEIVTVDYKPNVETDFGTQNRVRLGIDTDQDGKDGNPIRVFMTLNDSLHPRAQLYRVLTTLKQDPKPGFDFNNLLGTQVEFEIEHSTSQDGRVWSNIKNKELHLKRTTQQKTADQHSKERVQQAIESVRQQQQQPKSKQNGEAKSQWEGRKKKTAHQPEPDDEPLFPAEDENEINDEDIPF